MVVVASLVAGGIVVGVGGATFASIPHSDTKEISACRDNSNGGLRVIDAQANETCTGSETALSWSGAQSSIASFYYDSSEPTGNGVFDAVKSRNIADKKTAAYIDPYSNEALPGTCIHLTFVPKFVSPMPAYSIYEMDGTGADVVASTCGAGYEYFLMNTARASYFFTE
jgi:hypothetical protein